MRKRIISIFYSILIIIFGIGILFYLLIIKPIENKQNQENLTAEENLLEEEKVFLEEQKISTGTIVDIENTEVDIDEKIIQLKQKNNSIKTFDFEKLGEFYFVLLDNKLTLYNDGLKLGDYNYSEDIDLKEILGNDNYIFFQIGENKFLYNLKTNKSVKLNISVNINYIKNGSNTGEFLFNTEVGTFIYMIVENKFTYFNFFEDFVYFDDGYLGIINKEDETRLNNLSIQNNQNNLIYYYNPITKEKKLFLETEKELEKIYILVSKIYFEDIEGKVYELKNI